MLFKIVFCNGIVIIVGSTNIVPSKITSEIVAFILLSDQVSMKIVKATIKDNMSLNNINSFYVDKSFLNT